MIEEIGATTTIMVELLRQKGIPITPFEATIFALGIYEETGSLTFVSTTERDVQAVAYLISPGRTAEHRIRLHLARPYRRTDRHPEQPHRVAPKATTSTACPW